MAPGNAMIRRTGAWLRVAAEPTILRRALMTSLAVGVVLTLINHGGEILRGHLQSGDIAAIGLTFLIPFVVATSSSVAATERCGSALLQAVGRPEVERR